LGEYFWGRDPFLFGLYYYVYSRGRREFEEGASGIEGRVGRGISCIGITTTWYIQRYYLGDNARSGFKL
jgi:hypothetical protein